MPTKKIALQEAAAPERCMRRPAPIADRLARFPSSQTATGLCTAATATRSTSPPDHLADDFKPPLFEDESKAQGLAESSFKDFGFYIFDHVATYRSGFNP